MARQPRLILPKQPHHILQRGNDRQRIFREPEDYQRFLGWLAESARFYRVAIHAYALLPTHLHLLATPETEEGLAAMMQKLGRFYVPWYNAKYDRAGSLFEGRFRTAVVDTDRHFLMCSRYIELAPVHEGEAGEPAAYAWSSYRHHAGVQHDAVVTDHALFWGLGNTPFQREAAYIDLVGQGIGPDELAQIAGAVQKGQPLGAQAFKLHLERTTQRRILPAKRGRPFKKPVDPAI
jgi:putative transposase